VATLAMIGSSAIVVASARRLKRPPPGGTSFARSRERSDRLGGDSGGTPPQLSAHFVRGVSVCVQGRASCLPENSTVAPPSRLSVPPIPGTGGP
jgi:hypothetical protein